MSIYVLSLEHKKFYVGKTNKSVDEKFEEHKNGNGSAYTRLHKPLSIVEIRTIEDNNDRKDFLEDTMVKKYMRLYGIFNVRGGSYSQPFLSKDIIQVLRREVYSAKDACFNCGHVGHFIAECPEHISDEDDEDDEAAFNNMLTDVGSLGIRAASSAARKTFRTIDYIKSSIWG